MIEEPRPSSEGRVFRLKLSLLDNEILFKTIAATALSAMAIIVATAQWLTARKQLELTSLQTKIARANALPNFDISVVLRADPATGSHTDADMLVSNSGGPVHEVSAETMFFLSAEGELPGAQGWVKADIPVSGYYQVGSIGSASKGEVAHMLGRSNNRLVRDAQQLAITRAKASGWPFLFFDERLYLTLRYRDVMGDLHTDYFLVSEIGGARRVSVEEGEAWRKRWEQAPGTFQMARLQPDRLLAEIKRGCPMDAEDHEGPLRPRPAPCLPNGARRALRGQP